MKDDQIEPKFANVAQTKWHFQNILSKILHEKEAKRVDKNV